MSNKPIHIEVRPYKHKVDKWILKDADKFMGLMEDKSLQYQMGVTPQIKEEPE